MENYKKRVVKLGYSDISSLTLKSGLKVYNLNLGGDGDYRAYVINENCPIPAHYRLEWECCDWLWIYDDTQRVARFDADIIKIYRAGDYGVLIQLVNEIRVGAFGNVFDLDSFVKFAERELIGVFGDIKQMWSKFDDVFCDCTIYKDYHDDWSIEVEKSDNFNGCFWIYSEFSDVQFHMKVVENEDGTVEVVDFW